MRKVAHGFTLIELMLVVTIIGVLAAIAIPNFLRYQLRAKASELRENTVALFKAEEAIHAAERSGGPVTSGQYHALGYVPSTSGDGAACTPSSTKQRLRPGDIAAAQTIDWMIEGETYGCYRSGVTTGFARGTSGTTLTLETTSDIDSDGRLACMYLFKPVLDSDGAVTAAGQPACSLTAGAGTPTGAPVSATSDDVL